MRADGPPPQTATENPSIKRQRLKPPPIERRRIVVRSAVFTGTLGTVLFLFHAVYYETRAYDIAGFLAASCGAVCGWRGALLLWRYTVSPMPMFENQWLSLMIRAIFSFIGSGMGYTLGMLLARRVGLLEFWDEPVQPIFIDGGSFGCLMLLTDEILCRFQTSPRPQAPRTDINRKGTST